MFGDAAIKLIGLIIILFFAYKWAINYFGEKDEKYDSVEEIKKRKDEKEKMLNELRAKYVNLKQEIQVTDDLIIMKGDVEVSEDELANLDAALEKEKEGSKVGGTNWTTEK